MRAKKAKRMRREVYGDLSNKPEARVYYRDPKTGKIVSDKFRWAFQRLKESIIKGGV